MGPNFSLSVLKSTVARKNTLPPGVAIGTKMSYGPGVELLGPWGSRGRPLPFLGVKDKAQGVLGGQGVGL